MKNLWPVVLLLALGACSSSTTAGLPDIQLSSLSQEKAPSLASCPTAKCLTVYLAPWCGYCRAVTPQLVKLKPFLKDGGISMRVIVGMDKLESVREYAEVFGPDTLLDPHKRMSVNGVPHFYVSNAAGAIIKEVAGAPTGVSDIGEFASVFGLP